MGASVFWHWSRGPSLFGRFRRGRDGILWAFAILPPVAWPVQEVLERAHHVEGFAGRAIVDPSLIVGILLQIPFACPALLLARLLLEVISGRGMRDDRERTTDHLRRTGANSSGNDKKSASPIQSESVVIRCGTRG